MHKYVNDFRIFHCERVGGEAREVSSGAEEPLRCRSGGAVSATVRRQGLIRGAVRTHDFAEAHLQGSAVSRRRLLGEAPCTQHIHSALSTRTGAG